MSTAAIVACVIVAWCVLGGAVVLVLFACASMVSERAGE